MTTAKWLLLADADECNNFARRLINTDADVRFYTHANQLDIPNGWGPSGARTITNLRTWRPSLAWADYIWCGSYSYAAKLAAASEVGDAILLNWFPEVGLWPERSTEIFARLKLPVAPYLNGTPLTRGTLSGVFNPVSGWSPLFCLTGLPGQEDTFLMMDELNEPVVRMMVPFTPVLCKAGYIGLFTLNLVFVKQGIFALDISCVPNHDSLAALVIASGRGLQFYLASLLRGDMLNLLAADQQQVVHRA